MRSRLIISCIWIVVSRVSCPQSAVPVRVGAKSFEVASVKPCERNTIIDTNSGTIGVGTVSFNCQPLVDYIRTAYYLFANGRPTRAMVPIQIDGGPSWIRTDRYQISAKSESAQKAGAMAGPMMQALLEDRFKLKLHRESRVVPIYALEVTKGRLKLRPAKQPCITVDPEHPRQMSNPEAPICGFGKRTKTGVEVHGSTMEDFCLALSTRIPLRLDHRKIIDKTGVQGVFDFDLKFLQRMTLDVTLNRTSPSPQHPIQVRRTLIACRAR